MTNEQWARTCKKKAEIFANYLASIFQPNESSGSDYDNVFEELEQKHASDENIPLVTPKEIYNKIQNNLKQLLASILLTGSYLNNYQEKPWSN